MFSKKQPVMNAKEIAHAISFNKWNNDDLNCFIDAVKYARSQLARQTKRNLMPGDTVKFTSTRNGVTYTGTVNKVKIKYVLVRTNAGLYNVPANMLEAVE